MPEIGELFRLVFFSLLFSDSFLSCIPGDYINLKNLLPTYASVFFVEQNKMSEDPIISFPQRLEERLL